MAEETDKLKLEIPLPEGKKEGGMSSLIDGIDEVISESGDPLPAEPVFQEITSAEQFPPLMNFPVGLVLLALLALLLMGFLLYYLLKKKPPVQKKVNHYKEALRNLPALKERISAQSLGQTASDLSLLLREALKKSTDSPALFQSQKEFLSSDAVKLPSQSLSAEATDHLNALWSLEYNAPTHDPQRAEGLFSETETLLRKLSTS